MKPDETDASTERLKALFYAATKEAQEAVIQFLELTLKDDAFLNTIKPHVQNGSICL